MRAQGTIADVLVVDDDRDIRESLRALLELHGFAVPTARHGGEALELLARGRPRLMLLDWMMPEVSGEETLRRVRASPELAALPVLVITAAPNVRPHGVQVMPKPFDPPQLLARVRALTGEAHGEGQPG